MTQAERVEQTRQYLNDLPDLYSLLALFVLPGTGVSRDDRGGGGNPSRPTVNLDVLDLVDRRSKRDAERIRGDYELDRMAGARREGVLPTLTGWVRVVDEDLAEETLVPYVSPWRREACSAACILEVQATPSDLIGCCPGPLRPHPWQPRTIAGECAYLLTHLDWCGEQQWFHELETDVKRIRSDVRRVLRDVDPPALRCTVDTCGWPVEPMDGYFRCSGCGKTWSQVEVMRLYQRQQPMTLAEAAEVLGRPAKTLHHWVAKRWLRHVARDSRGRLYDYQHVLNVAAKIATRTEEKGRAS